MCHNEEWFVNEMNRQLQDKLNMNITLNGVFIDAQAKFPGEDQDETQQMYFQQETAKLFDFLQNKEDFYFRTIDDVLAENAALKEENKRLHDIIKLFPAMQKSITYINLKQNNKNF